MADAAGSGTKALREGIAAGFGDKTDEQKAAAAYGKTGARAQLAPDDGESFVGFVADGFVEMGKGAANALGFGSKKEKSPYEKLATTPVDPATMGEGFKKANK